MDRREFIEQVAAWSAGALMATPVFNVASVLAAEAKPRSKPLLSVAKGKDYAELVASVLKPARGNRRLRAQRRPRRGEAEHRLGPHARAGRQHPSRRGQGGRSAVSRRRGQAGPRLRSHLQRPAPLLHAKRNSSRGGIDRRPQGAMRFSGPEQVRAGQDREGQVDPRVRSSTKTRSKRNATATSTCRSPSTTSFPSSRSG